MPIITSLINKSLEEAIIPNILKTSIIRPIYKSGKKSDYNNYRPIAILPAVEKVLEEIVARRLNEFLLKYKIISKNQYGFQKGKNINQLLGIFSNEVNKSLDKNEHCLGLFIDFSKAFDTLSHNKMIEVLEHTGIRGNCIEWFKNYLECRNYSVKLQDRMSDNIPLKQGVPQGSKLGPILYIIYANDMMRVLRDSNVYAYADDTAIIVSNKCSDTAMDIMQIELNKITKWCHDRGLIINASKTKLMHFRPRHLPETRRELIFQSNDCLHKTYYNNKLNRIPTETCTTRIEQVKTYKYLGVHLDVFFKWKTHVEHLQKKLKRQLMHYFT